MKPGRTLSLRREELGRLEPADLRTVVGGTHLSHCSCAPTQPLTDCIDRLIGQTA